MDERELSLAVVGIRFENADKAKTSRRFEVRLCRPGDPVELRLEPKNPHDSNAVAVFSERGIQLGYLSAERAPFVGALIKAAAGEVTAVFQEEQAEIAVIRVRFGGGAPTLPRPRAETDRGATNSGARRDAIEGEFYPDPEGPEWGA